jgi:hypothetical protein
MSWFCCVVVEVSIDIRKAFRMTLFSTASISADETPPPAFVHVSVPLASVVRTWFAEPTDVGYVNCAPPELRTSAEDDSNPEDVRVSEPVPTWRLPLTWRLFSIVDVPVPPT